MSDELTQRPDAGEGKTFAELVDAYDAGIGDDVQVGDKIEGEIISIGMDTVFVNTGSKIDGSVDREELLDESGELPYAVGDTLSLYVVALEENEIRLSRAISGIGGLNLLQDAHAEGIPVEGKVVETCKGGFHVEVIRRRAFCPISQIDTRYVATPEDYVGREFQFLVSRIEENGRNIVVSRRELLMREQETARQSFLETVNIGDVLEGRVTSLMPYGIFVELSPGVEGMVHVSEMSWSRIGTPADAVAVDDPVTVQLMSLDEGKKPGEVKISLSMKAVTGDPWERIHETFSAGDKVRGKVTRCADFGAFVEIAPGIEGLVHVSEMSYARRVLKPEDEVSPGEGVDVLIKEIDTERKRVSLSIRDAVGDPWIGVADRYALGQTVEGTVEKVERFGIFVTIEPGVTGLMPRSKISRSANVKAFDRLQPGDPIPASVAEIHPNDRKITLTPADARDTDDWRDYARKERGQGGSSGGLGDLGEKLQQALKKKGG